MMLALVMMSRRCLVPMKATYKASLLSASRYLHADPPLVLLQDFIHLTSLPATASTVKQEKTVGGTDSRGVLPALKVEHELGAHM